MNVLHVSFRVLPETSSTPPQFLLGSAAHQDPHSRPWSGHGEMGKELQEKNVHLCNGKDVSTFLDFCFLARP